MWDQKKMKKKVMGEYKGLSCPTTEQKKYVVNIYLELHNFLYVIYYILVKS